MNGEISPNPHPDRSAPREGYLPIGHAELYYREIGSGKPIILLHGGPDFNHDYFLPEMDRVLDSFRIIYYDQRGRGKSTAKVHPEDVSIASEIEDIERLREYFKLESAAIMGHSFGGLLAMEYALRHPERVSHLILLNSAPASRNDYMLFRQERRRNTPEDIERLKSLASTANYLEGDLETEAAYYRIHFHATLRSPQHLESLVKRLRLSFTKEGILQARKIEDRLMDETWLAAEYNLLPQLQQLSMPALIIHGDTDFIPLDCAAHIAQAIPGSRLVVLKDTGHFSFIERPDEVRQEIVRFFHVP